MAGTSTFGGWRKHLRIAAWSAAGALLLLPLIAMQFTDEVDWTVSDFAFAGIMILGTGLAFEGALKLSPNLAYRAAFGLALVTAFLLVWSNLAVGIIGSENNDLNDLYGGVLLVGVVGAFIARFRPAGMARALVAVAIAQGLVAIIALLFGYFTLFLNGGFIAFWLGSAHLFQRAAEEQEPDRVPPRRD